MMCHVQTYRELLQDAIQYDEPFLAHAIYFAVQRKLVRLDDPADRFQMEGLDFDEIRQNLADNVLGLSIIKLFAIKVNPHTFAFYLATRVEEAQAEHRRYYGQLSERVIDMTDKMDKSLYVPDTRTIETYRDIKNRTVQFPSFVGEYVKGAM